MKEEFAVIRPRILRIGFEVKQAGLMCHEGLDLQFRRDARKRNPYLGKTFAICDICNAEIPDIGQGYAACSNANNDCDYDCCLACFKGKLPDGLVLGKTCGQTHPLLLHTTHKLDSELVDIVCALCKEEFPIEDGYVTCD